MPSFIWNAGTILPTFWKNTNRPATYANTKAFVVGRFFFDRMKAHASAQSDFTSRFNNRQKAGKSSPYTF